MRKPSESRRFTCWENPEYAMSGTQWGPLSYRDWLAHESLRIARHGRKTEIKERMYNGKPQVSLWRVVA